jgi:hypothetical protein
MAVAADDFDELLDAFLTGRLSADGAARLLASLEADPARAAGLLDQLAVDALLRDLAGHATRPTPAPAAQRRHRWPWAVAVALALSAAGVAVWLWPRPVPTAHEETTTAVAVLARSVGARWAGPAVPSAGAALAPGTLRLEAGLAEVEFFGGARVILQGPAEFRLVSSSEAFCQSGRLTAEVPPHAAGFRLGTPRRDVVDRGTAFGLSVTDAGAEVHVFHGTVELHGPAGPDGEGLTTGQAVALGADGAGRRLAADPASFVTRAELDRRQDEADRRAREAAAAAGRAWDADPALLARFDFESDGRTLANRAAGRAVGDGTVVGCGRAEGRWPGKGALEFGGVSDRVLLAVPGEYRSLTLAAWVRVHGLDRRYNSLLMADGFDSGAVHWQVLNDGRVRLGIGGKPRHSDHDSPRVFTPDRLGQWVHLAVVHDADTGRVSHYADGLPLSREPTRLDVPLRPGRAGLGNWDPGRRVDAVPIRHFSGRMDEFVLFARALSDDEVRRLAMPEP